MLTIEHKKRAARPIRLTPLIDVMCFLVVFFMLTAGFVKTESIELSLPQKMAPSKSSGGGAAVLYLTPEGAVFYGARPVDQSELPILLERLVKSRKEQGVAVAASSGASVQDLVTLIDRIQLAGGKQIAIMEWKQP